MHDPVSYAICLIAALALIVLANFFVPILRDIPASGVTPGQRVPYSLARVQMAFWTIVIVGSLIYVHWIVGEGKGDFPKLHASFVGLIGISGATGVIAAAIDIGKDSAVEGTEAEFVGTAEALRALDAQIMAAASAPGATGADPTLAKLFADRAVKMGELARQQKVMSRSKRADDAGVDARAQATALMSKIPSRQHRGIHYVARFFKEILEDQNGNSLHRLQLVMFTLIYGTYVMSHVATATVPADALSTELLDGQALALLGISSGIYVGFKIPGKAS